MGRRDGGRDTKNRQNMKEKLENLSILRKMECFFNYRSFNSNKNSIRQPLDGKVCDCMKHGWKVWECVCNQFWEVVSVRERRKSRTKKTRKKNENKLEKILNGFWCGAWVWTVHVQMSLCLRVSLCWQDEHAWFSGRNVLEIVSKLKTG